MPYFYQFLLCFSTGIATCKICANGSVDTFNCNPEMFRCDDITIWDVVFLVGEPDVPVFNVAIQHSHGRSC